MENTIKVFWCHNCRMEFTKQNCNFSCCPQCQGDLVEEVKIGESHPGDFIPETNRQPQQNPSFMQSIVMQILSRGTRQNQQVWSQRTVLSNCKKLKFEDVGDSESCSICFNEYLESDKIIQLPCKHHYHKNCALAWLPRHRSCPYCRQSIS